MKSSVRVGRLARDVSHPTRVRGLKFHFVQSFVKNWIVAPHPGAWIEIEARRRIRRHEGAVAPHPGAWIEILIIRVVNFACRVAPHPGAWIEIIHTHTHTHTSHPTRVRGLKFAGVYKRVCVEYVAPHPGAWIEIYYPHNKLIANHESHPTRVRGLKFYFIDELHLELSRTPPGCVD